MSDPSELKSVGLKATLPRLKILSLFETSDQRHLSAEDIYRVLLNEHEDVGLATVYRVLTQFEQAGLLIRHHFESGKPYSNSTKAAITITWSACNAAGWKSSSTPKSKNAKRKSPKNAASRFANTRCIYMWIARRRIVHIGLNAAPTSPPHARGSSRLSPPRPTCARFLRHALAYPGFQSATASRL